MAPKRAVTQSLQVLGSARRLVSAWREVPGELSDSLSPKLGTPKAGPVPDPGLKDRFLSPPEAASPPSHLCRLRPHARFSGKCSPTVSGGGAWEGNGIHFRPESDDFGLYRKCMGCRCGVYRLQFQLLALVSVVFAPHHGGKRQGGVRTGKAFPVLGK